MADYNIDINVNMGGSGNSFQTLIDSVNRLNANFEKVGTSAASAGAKTKQSFADSMAVIKSFENGIKGVTAEILRQRNVMQQQDVLLKKKIITQEQYNKNINTSAAEIKRLETAQRQYNKVLGQTSSQVKATSTGLTGLTTAFNKLGAVLGVSFGLYGVFRALTSVIKTISEFDLAQKKLRSVLGETAEGMKDISDSAIQIGKSSIFGARGVSELQIELAKMGFTKNDIIAMQGAIVNLATATQEDLASSAEVVANVLRTFNLTAGEATMVVDVMGKAFNDSALDLSNFRESIKYVAPIAAQANFTFAETVSLLEQLSNAGIKGSLAGTGLTNVISRIGNANSKFAKTLGRTVDGFDDFIEGLIEMKNRGIDITGVFELVDRRAAAVFSILLDGTETVKQFKERLEDASGVMETQAAVQLDSIAYRAKLAKESWKAFILEMDSGNSIVSQTVKGFLSLSDALITVMSDPSIRTEQIMSDILNKSEDIRRIYLANSVKLNLAQKEEYDEILEKTREYYSKLQAANEQYAKRVEFARQAPASQRPLLIGNAKAALQAEITQLQQDFPNMIGELAGIQSLIVSKASKPYVDAFNDLAESSGDAYKAFEISIKNLIELKKTALSANDKEQAEVYVKAINDIGNAYEKISGFNAGEGDDSAEKARLKALEDRYKYELDILKLKQQSEEERIKRISDGYLQEILLEENTFKFKKLIADKELEMTIALGGNKLRETTKYNLEMQVITAQHSNKMVEIGRDMDAESLKFVEEALKETSKTAEESTKDLADFVIAEYKRITDAMQFMDKWESDNPILNLLFGKKLEKSLLDGIVSEDDITNFTESFDLVFENIGDSLNEYVDSWVEATDRVVDQLNRQVDETQRAVDTEAELMAAGYANNLTLRRKELEDLKKARRDALSEQRKAQQAQVAIDTITQVSSLITASAQIIKGFSAIPIIGTALGIGAVAVMIGAFAAAKAKAYQTAGINKFEQGGWIGGVRHSQGGTHIEAERDEFVVRRSSAIKHGALIEAINKDDTYEINRIYLNKMKGQVLSTRVSLDDSKDLKAIRALMEKGEKNIEYHNGYRIERIGNVTTKIRLN